MAVHDALDLVGRVGLDLIEVGGEGGKASQGGYGAVDGLQRLRCRAVGRRV